jgi:predicted phosphodiesterase
MKNSIKVPKGTKLAVIGDIHSHDKQFYKILEKIQPSKNMWFISLGDVFDKGFGEESSNKITNELIKLCDANIGFAVKGNHELKNIKKNKHNLSSELRWWKGRPLSLSFEFFSGTRLTCIHAGVTPKMLWEDLDTNVEVCYVRDIDDHGEMIRLKWIEEKDKKILVKVKEGGYSWSEKYDGRFGYIAFGHAAQKTGIPKFYNYSCNLDTAVYETGILTAQIFNDDGSLGDLIQVHDEAFKPELEERYY